MKQAKIWETPNKGVFVQAITTPVDKGVPEIRKSKCDSVVDDIIKEMHERK